MGILKRWMEHGKNIKKALVKDTIEDLILHTLPTLSDGNKQNYRLLGISKIMHIFNILPIIKVKLDLKQGRTKIKKACWKLQKKQLSTEKNLIGNSKNACSSQIRVD